MSDSKGAAIDEQIMDIFMEAVALRITPKQYTDKILAILAQEVKRVIGEDEPLPMPTYPVRLKERNELRAEQRRKAGLV